MIEGTFQRGAKKRIRKRDVSLIQRELAKIAKRCGGSYTPKDVVETVRPWDKRSKHPLKRYFTADLAAAARERWVDQARYLIQSVVFVTKATPGGHIRVVRAQVSVAGRYVPIQRAMADQDMRALVVAEARVRLQAWYQRYKDYEELAAEVEHVGRALGPENPPE